MNKVFCRFISLLLVSMLIASFGSVAIAEDVPTFAEFLGNDHVSDAEYAQKKSEYGMQYFGGSSALLRAVPRAVSGNRAYNEYIEYVVDSDSGLFTVGTTGGNPALSSDNNKYLLYGHGDPWSSYTTVRVNGTNYVYGEDGLVTRPYFSGNSNISSAKYGNVTVQQVISLVQNISTLREDVVEIKYIVKNTGSSTVNLGMRIMLDTMLADNDDAPFRIPGVGDVMTEMEFTGNNIPQYWQAFDSLTDPDVVSYGNFLSAAIKPDKVQFVGWERVNDLEWGYNAVNGRTIGDSAVCVIWERRLAPGQQETYVTRYGLSELLQDMRAPLALTIASANSVQIDTATGEYMPYTITAYVQNVGESTVKNAVCTIQLPDMLAFVNAGEDGVIELGDLAVGEVKTIEKVVYVKNPPAEACQTSFRVTVDADNADSKTLTKNVTIPVMDDEEIVLPETGDATPVMLYLACLLLSGAALVLIIGRRRTASGR